MGVSAIVVTYNRLSLLKECISKLLNQTYKLDYIFLVNNNSSDGTATYLNKIHNSRIIVKNLNKNIGGAGGFNIGTKLAFKYSKSDYFWIMDDDTMPTKNSLDALVHKAHELNQFGFLCSNVRWWKNGTSCNIPSVSYDWPELINKSLIKVCSATFVSILVPRIRVGELGFPIRGMFIWGDDTEYTTRLSQEYNSYFVPSSVVLHKSASNKSYETIFNASMKRVIFYKCMYRNLIYIDKKYYPLKHLIRDLMGFVSDLFEIPFKAKNHRAFRIFIVLYSIFKGLFFHPVIDIPKHKSK